MTHADFFIGLEFWTGEPSAPVRWRCTDVGTRTIAAIELENEDPNWWGYKGPPYGIVEDVFDENDFAGCHPIGGCAMCHGSGVAIDGNSCEDCEGSGRLF